MATNSKRSITSYFFYGTYPVPVQNHLINSNSANAFPIANEQTTQHLSLGNGLLSISERNTTQSLQDLSNFSNNHEENNEVNLFSSSSYFDIRTF